MIFNIKICIFLLSLVCFNSISIAQSTTLSVPEKLLLEAENFEKMHWLSLEKAETFQKLGNTLMDSVYSTNRYIQENKTSTNLNVYITLLEQYYSKTFSFIAKADSFAILSENYKDISLSKIREAYAMMGMDVPSRSLSHQSKIEEKDILPVNNNMLASQPTPAGSYYLNRGSTYVIQMGAGKMDMKYFDKIPNIIAVDCKDGVKRYIIDGVFTAENAYKKRDELTKLGYEQIFIRTKESLDRIKN